MILKREAALAALKALELEREAVRHCDSLANPEYVRLMRESLLERWRALDYFEQS